MPEHNFHVARSLVGSEGTLVTILEATLHLVPQPAANTLLVLGYPDTYSAADHLMEILEDQPIGLEGIHQLLIDWMKLKKAREANLKLMPDGAELGFLFSSAGISKQDSDAQAERCLKRLENVKTLRLSNIYDEPDEEERLWKIRESGLSATAWVPNTTPTTGRVRGSALPTQSVGPYLCDLGKLMDKFHYKASLYGHFGQGCIHCRIPFNLTARKAFVDGSSSWRRPRI